MRTLKTLAALTLLTIIASGCTQTGIDVPSQDVGTLQLTIRRPADSQIKTGEFNQSARTISPAADETTVQKISVTLKDPDGAETTQFINNDTPVFTDLKTGKWQCTIKALNKNDTVLYEGSQSFTINPLLPTKLTLELAQKKGNAIIYIMVVGGTEDVPYEITPNTCSITTLLEGSNPSSPSFVFLKNQTYVLNQTLDQGTYRLTSYFRDTNGKEVSITEIIQVFADIPINKSFNLTEADFTGSTSTERPLKALWLDTTEIALLPGMEQQIMPLRIPTDATSVTLEWASDNTETVIVDDSGKITAVAPGTARITVSDAASKISRSINVDVLSSYSIGDRGPSGGYIFYDAGADSISGWRYLECAPKDLNSTKYNLNTNVFIETSIDIGTGQTNTANINIQNPSKEYAAYASSIHTVNGVTGWFLPSWKEMILLATAAQNNPSIALSDDRTYNTSSQCPPASGIYYEYWYSVRPLNGITTELWTSSWEMHYVRPIRSF